MKFIKTQDKNTQISVYCIQHYSKQNFGIIKQLLPALAVNIIIVHPLDVVFPRAKDGPAKPKMKDLFLAQVKVYRHGMCFRASSVFVLSILF